MAGRRRKPGECLCPCHQNGLTILGGPCAWCRDLHRPGMQEERNALIRVALNDGGDADAERKPMDVMPILGPDDPPDWRGIAATLAWSMTGEKHTAAQQKALDLYDSAVDVEAAQRDRPDA